MDDISAPHQSFWNRTAPQTDFGQLQGGATADVAIIGGGIVGITLAELLKREGRSVAVIENQRVGTQVTGCSTAKLTALHGLVYAELIDKHGEETARAYAQANQEALAYVAERVASLGIDCALEGTAAYTHSESGHGLAAIRSEVDAARRLGLPVEFVDEAPLPFPIAGAIRMDNQYQFHPTRYVVGLAQTLPGDGSAVFEHTRALKVEEGVPHRVITDRGVVTATDVVVATNMPFTDIGLFFSKAYPYAHAVLAARIGEQSAPGGMFLSTERQTYSVRPYRHEGSTVLIATGPSVHSGHGDIQALYRGLEEYVRSRFDVQEILCWWTNEDYYSMDRVPYIGKLAPQSRRVYIATGFSGWGLSGGTLAARLLADRVLERSNPYAFAYESNRWKPRVSGRKFTTANLHMAREFVTDRLQALRALRADDLPRDEGGIVRHEGRLTAAYRDAEGHLHTFSPDCTHLRCLLRWNRTEKTWDCPCHGSRFDRMGRLLHGPAVRDMVRRG